MTDIKKILTDKVKSIVDNWDADGIYAISFFVESNENNTYNDYKNVSEFAVSYNTESECEGIGLYDEERWNYAFWLQNETYVIDTANVNEETRKLYDWYAEQNITDIGREDEDCYDENMCYIGKGPVGHYELLMLAAEVARSLQSEGYIKRLFKKDVPIIVHGLEYAWYDIEATKLANPNNEAADFLKYVEMELGL